MIKAISLTLLGAAIGLRRVTTARFRYTVPSGLLGAVVVALGPAALERRARELEKANAELERFNRLAVGREHRMIALKREVNELVGARNPKYDLSFLSEE